jgi:hypothetical protein
VWEKLVVPSANWVSVVAAIANGNTAENNIMPTKKNEEILI